MPAFIMAVSTLSGLSARVAKSLTLAKLSRFSSRTPTTLIRPVDVPISAFAERPLEMVRMPRMAFEAPGVTMCRTVSRPSPLLAWCTPRNYLTV